MARKPALPATPITTKVVKWENETGEPLIGQVVEGKLLSAELGVETSQGKNNVYRIENEAEELLTIFGSAILNRALAACAVGDWVIIKLVGTQPSQKKGHSPLKLFEVSKIPADVVNEDESVGDPA